jgi:hypothetical protein
MNIQEFQNLLLTSPNLQIKFILPDGTLIPEHFHITEVGRVQKDFIDCGGTLRQIKNCLLQTWVANDVDHRLNAKKLAEIIKLASSILNSENLPVEIEFENKLISQFPIIDFKINETELIFNLGTKHTDCLAKDKCKIDLTVVDNNSCNSTSGCC